MEQFEGRIAVVFDGPPQFAAMRHGAFFVPLTEMAPLSHDDARAIAGIEMVEDGKYLRTIALDGVPLGEFDVATCEGHATLKVVEPRFVDPRIVLGPGG